jgi:hypothetical protein
MSQREKADAYVHRRAHARASSYFFAAAFSAAAFSYFLLKRSTRPAVSSSFCLPVKNGWQFEQISTRSSWPFIVERQSVGAGLRGTSALAEATAASLGPRTNFNDTRNRNGTPIAAVSGREPLFVQAHAENKRVIVHGSIHLPIRVTDDTVHD